MTNTNEFKLYERIWESYNLYSEVGRPSLFSKEERAIPVIDMCLNPNTSVFESRREFLRSKIRGLEQSTNWMITSPTYSPDNENVKRAKEEINPLNQEQNA